MPPLPTLRRRDVVLHCNDVNVRVGRRHIIFAKTCKMSRTESENRLSVCCHLQGANAPIIHVFDVSDDPDGIFACQVQHRSQHPLSTKPQEFALSVAAVDTRSLAGARNHCEGSVHVVLRARETTARGVYFWHAVRNHN
jgi:hypothetical protein